MPAADSEQTRRTLIHHLEAFDQGDIDAVLSDYAVDAVLLTPKGVRRGHGQIREELEWLLANVFIPSSSFSMVQQLFEGELAYIVWSAESERYRVPMATDTYLIREGKIVTQTFAATLEPKSV
jgi:ketosteroid isomerase-like protein